MYSGSEFQLNWDNEIALHVARNLLRLRTLRKLSQTEVAELAGTSQSAIARIEAAEENITIKTLKRLISSLGGRLLISIQPKEMPVLRQPPWWTVLNATLDASNWEIVGWAYRETESTEQLVIGAERNKAQTTMFLPALNDGGTL